MRVCMVAYTHYEPDNRVRRYAEKLADLGWEVDAIVLRKTGQEKQKSVGKVNVFRIQERIHNEKSKITYFLRLFRFLFSSTIFLAKRHLQKKYDLIHVHSIPDYEVFAAIVPKLFGAKIILDIHDLVPELFIAKFKVPEKSVLFKTLVAMEKLSAAFADHVIIANHIWHKRIVNRSVKAQKCSVVMNYPDNKIFGKRKRTRTDDNFVMMYPGTLSRHQGIELVIEALYQIRSDVPKLKFHIFGSGTDSELLKELTMKRNLTDIVSFFDPVSLEEIADKMANADMGIEPKQNTGFSDEAFSTKILEFMLLGVPVIASDTSVHQYYIPKDSVKYFQAGNIKHLAESIIFFYSNENERVAYADRAKQFVKSMCWDVRSNEYMDIVQSLLPGNMAYETVEDLAVSNNK